MQGGPAHIFFEAPSPLFLLLFKLVTVSMGEFNASVVVGTVLTLGFFFDGTLVTGSIGCSIMLGGIGAVTDVNMYFGRFVWFHAFSRRGSCSRSYSRSCRLILRFVGGFPFFFLVTSVQPSSAFLGWTWPDSLAVVLLVLLLLVAVVIVTVVEAVEAAAFGGYFLGKILICAPPACSSSSVNVHPPPPSSTSLCWW